MFQIKIYSKDIKDDLSVQVEKDKIDEMLQNISKGTLIWSKDKKSGWWINPSTIVFIYVTELKNDSVEDSKDETESVKEEKPKESKPKDES
jgi:hypothetical protein